MLVNLYEETIERVEKYLYRPEHIHHVVVQLKNQKKTTCISWDDFVKASKKIKYNPGYGLREISPYLKIVFNDGCWLERQEYDGSEWWSYRRPESLNVKIVPFNNEEMTLQNESGF